MSSARSHCRARRLSRLLRGLAVAAVGAMAMTPCATAGELTLAWNAAGPAGTTSYRVFVGDRPGVYDRVVDAGAALRATITDLEDGKIHYLAVKAVDARGHESSDFSPELACMARPRVDEVLAPGLAPGTSGWVTLRGANFDRDAQVRSLDPALRVRATALEPDGSLSVFVETLASALRGLPTPSTTAFSVLNPCRRADPFFRAHPQAADVDGSGAVDQEDVRAVSAAFGSRLGESAYSSAADVDGDGIIDGRDLDRVIALVSGARLDAARPAVSGDSPVPVTSAATPASASAPALAR